MARPTVIDAANLSALLSTLLTPNSAAIRETEDHLRRALAQPAFICDLFEQIQSSPSAELRQLAAVLVRRRVGSLWLKLEPPIRKALQAALIQRLGAEPERLVRRSLTSVVAVVAKSALPKGEWPELAPFLFEATRSSAAEHRELSMHLLASLLESEDVVEAALRPHFAHVSATLQTLLADQSSPHVRRATLKAVGAWAFVLIGDEALSQLAPLLAPLHDVCRASAESFDEESLVCAFELLQQVLEAASNALLEAHLAPLLALALDVLTASSMEEDTRFAALHMVMAALEYRKKLIVRQKLAAGIVQKLFACCAEACAAREGDDDDDETLEKGAGEAIHLLASNLPSKHAAPHILECAHAYSRDAQQPARRRAAIIGLAMAAEGCCDTFEEVLPQLLPLVYAACADDTHIVREAACIALGEFAQNLQPTIITHYQQVLPHIFMVLNDATEKVKLKSCYALEAFCENLGDDILPFLEPLLEKLTSLLHNATHDTQRSAISALASVALAAGGQFRPYYAHVFSFMRVLLQQTGEQELLLRARAMECLGVMHLAVGRAHCEAMLPECTAAALAGLALDVPELKEYTYGFFGQLAELIGDEISPILPQFLPTVLASLDAEDAIQIDDGEAPDGLAATAAAHCIAECARHAGGAFAPHIEVCLKSLWETCEYFHPEVRGASTRALAFLVTAAAKAEGVQWTKGQILAADTLPAGTRALHGQVSTALMKIFGEDDDKDVVAAASEALSELATGLGPAGIAHLAPKLTQISIKLLKQKHNCMVAEEDDPDAELDPDADHDNALWEAVSELLTNLPKVMGDGWLIHFSKLLPVLKPYLAAGHPARDRSLAIGILAESLHQLEGAGAGFFHDILPLALRCAADDDVTARQNATFCLGVLGLHGGAGALHEMQQLLTALQPRLAAEEEPAVRDNAVGALARLVLAFGNSLPLAQIVPAIVGHLPLKADPGENIPCCRSLMAVAQDAHSRPHLGPHLAHVLGVFALFVQPDSLDKYVTAQMQADLRAFLQWMLGAAPEVGVHLPVELGGSKPA